MTAGARPDEGRDGALVVGEALIDEVVTGDRADRHPGGSPANVALGLARLGVATRLHTAIGDDPDGALIARQLSASGVSLTAASVTGTPTSRAVAVLAPDGSATYRFTLSWDPAPLEDAGAPALIHTGSLGAFLEPGAAVTADILARGRERGALISVDPNIRASLLPAPESTRAAFARLLALSHLVKLSDEDAAYLYPGATPAEVLDLLLAGGAGVAAMTRGAEGAVLASGAGRIDLPAVRTTVADTVGAGDSFMAALIGALVFDRAGRADAGRAGAGRADAGWDGAPIGPDRLAAIARTAARAAAITVSRPGADLPTRQDLDEYPDHPEHRGEA